MIEPVVGAYGVRTFRVSRTGVLMPVTMLSGGIRSWESGSCTAVCNRSRVTLNVPSIIRGIASGITRSGSVNRLGGGSETPHVPPADGCTCGVYSFKDVVTLRRQYAPSYFVTAVVALEGETVEGSKGYRSAAARIIGIWMYEGYAWNVLWRRRTRAVMRRYPLLRRYGSPEQLVADFPGVWVGDPVAWKRQQLPRHRLALAQIRAGVSANFLYIWLGWLALHWLITKGRMQ